MKINKKTAILLGLSATVFVFCTAGTIAYLTDYDSTVNEFTIGKVDIELEEPDWKPEDHKKIEPGEELAKDPQIKNTGENDAYVYLEVCVPVRNVITAADDGTRKDVCDTELFSFTAGDDWTLIQSSMVGTDMVYTYSYDSILAPQETSSALFDKVTFCNLIEGQLDREQISIPVRAYGIQTVNTGDQKESIEEQAKAAYEKYVNQNMNQTGKVTQ